MTDELLEILLAEQRDIGPDRQQQLGDDGGDAVEMAGPRLAFPPLATRRETLTVVAKPCG